MRVVVRPGGIGDGLLLAPSLRRILDQEGEAACLVGYPARLAPLVRAGLAGAVLSLDGWLKTDWGKPDAASLESGFLKPVANGSTDLERIRIDSFFPTLPPSLPKHWIARIHPSFPEADSSGHVAEYYAKRLGFALDRTRGSYLRGLLRPRNEREGPRIWIHPGAGGPDKRWPLPRFPRLASRLKRTFPGSIVFPLGEADGDLEADLFESGCVVRRFYSLEELIGHFAEGDVYIGNDAGPTHLAALLGLPTLAVFGPTDPRVWGPWGERAMAVTSRAGQGWPSLEEVESAARALLEVGSS